MLRHVLKGLGFGVLAGALAAVAFSQPFGRGIEAQTYDWRLASQPTPARDDIAIVEINESSVRALADAGYGRWPWPRALHARVINFLSRAGARTIVYDVQFTEPDSLGRYRLEDEVVEGPASDDQLIAAVRRAGNVVLLADALFEGFVDDPAGGSCQSLVELPGTTYAPGDGLPLRPDVRLPFPALARAAATVGHNFLDKGDGGVSRAMHPFIACGSTAVPSLGLAAVMSAELVPADAVRLEPGALRVGDRRLPLDERGQLLLKLHGPFGDPQTGKTTFPVYPVFNLLVSDAKMAAGEPPIVDPALFADKTVFVGTSATGLADVHRTAFGGVTPGVYLHATLADNVLANDYIRRSSGVTDLALTISAGLAAGVLAMTLPVWWALGLIAAGGLGLVAAVTRAVGAGLWLPLAAPVAAGTLALLVSFAWQYFVEGREKREVKRLFGRYVSRDIFEQLLANPAMAHLGGERREMTVLFSDIRGFTTATEKGTPEAVVAQLNEYFSEMVAVLFRHQGTLDKFVGDMVMGLFGAPVADPQHADHAVAAALEMITALDALNARWKAEGRPQVDIGVGINTGEMIAGNIGSEAIMSYTVIGDAVNLGSRLESLNKEYGTRILISQSTKDRLTMPVETRLVGEAKVKGRAQSVVVYEVRGGAAS